MNVDQVTINKEILTFVRVLVEIPLHQEYPSEVVLENKIGKIVKKNLVYKLKPILCTNYKNFGQEIKVRNKQQ